MCEKTKEQLLQELTEIQKMLEKKVEIQSLMIKRFQMLTYNEGLFSQVIDYCPYPIAVFTSQGTLATANNALLTETKIDHKDLREGKCKIIKHNSDDFRLINAIKKVFAGNTFYLEGLKNPLSIFSETKRKNESDFEKFKKAIIFPISGDNGEITHGAVIILV